MLNKKILLKVDGNTLYDERGNQYWIARYDLPCSICGKQQPSIYFRIKNCVRYCHNCVTVLSLKDVFSAQLEVYQREEKARKFKEEDAKRLKAEQAAAAERKQEELEFEAMKLYTAFMDYHEVHNEYVRPEWKDAIEGDKAHFYHMADRLRDFKEILNECEM